MIRSNRKTLIVLVSALLSVSFSIQSIASPAWARGAVKYVYLTLDGFYVTLDTPWLDDCQYDRIRFKESTLGANTLDRAYSMALAAQASGRSFEVVIDKAINGPEGECEALGSTLIKDL